MHNVAATLMPQHQNYNVPLTYYESQILCSTNNVVGTLTTSNSQRLHNVDITTSHLRRCTNVALSLDIKFNSQYIMGVVIATSKQHGNGDVKFTLILSTSILQRCTNVASATSVNYSFLQLCVEVINMINNDVAFVQQAGYAGSKRLER